MKTMKVHVAPRQGDHHEESFQGVAWPQSTVSIMELNESMATAHLITTWVMGASWAKGFGWNP